MHRICSNICNVCIRYCWRIRCTDSSVGPTPPQGAINLAPTPLASLRSPFMENSPAVSASLVTCILLTCCPHLHCMIYTGRGKQLSVWRPCHRYDVAGVATIGKDVISGDSIPHLYHLITATCSDKPAIWRPSH